MLVEKKREEVFECSFYWFNAAIIVIILSGMILGAALLFIHWLTPKNCWLKFLDTDQLDRITTILLSALATNALKDTYKKA